MLPRPHRAQGHRGRDAGLRRLPDGERQHRLRRPVLGLAEGGRRPARVPGTARGQPAEGGDQPGPGQRRRRRRAARPTGGWRSGSSAPATTRRRCCCPRLAQLPNAHLAHVATTRSLSAVNAQRRFGFTTASTNADAVLEDETLDAIFIVTRHHTHADLVCRALETGKAVFVEKPLALTREELDRIVEVIAKTGNDRLMVGFNRRFAPLLTQMKSRVRPGELERGHALPGQRGPAGRRQLVPQRRAGRIAVHRRGRPLHRHAELVGGQPSRGGLRRPGPGEG